VALRHAPAHPARVDLVHSAILSGVGGPARHPPALQPETVLRLLADAQEVPRPGRLPHVRRRRGEVNFLAHGIYEGLVFYARAELDDLAPKVVRRDLTVAIRAASSPGTDLALGAAEHALRVTPAARAASGSSTSSAAATRILPESGRSASGS
jgi:hypothetical protein